MGTDDELSIGALARHAGIKTSALRYYEEVGLLKPSRRVSGRRRYAPSATQRLDVIKAAQRVGFTIAEIRLLVRAIDRGAPSKRWREMAEGKLDEIAHKVGELERMRALLEEGLRCDCLDLVTCVALIGGPLEGTGAA